MADTEDDGPAIRPFNVTLAELDKGRVHNELSEKFHDLIGKVEDTRKGGTITLTMKVAFDKKADMLRVSTNVVAKAPVPDRADSLYFVDRDGNPSRQDPNQRALFEANEKALKSASVPNIQKEA